jgi:hypothetical protein
MGKHRRIFLRDGNLAIVVVGHQVVETDGLQDGARRTRRYRVAEFGNNRDAHVERLPGADTPRSAEMDRE